MNNLHKFAFGLTKTAWHPAIPEGLMNSVKGLYGAGKGAINTGMDSMKNMPAPYQYAAGAAGGAATGGAVYGLKKLLFDHRTQPQMPPQVPPPAPSPAPQGMDWKSMLSQGANYAAVPSMIGAGIGGLGGLLGGGGLGGTLGGAAEGAGTGLGAAGGFAGGSMLANYAGVQDPTARLLFGLGGGALGGYLGNRAGSVFNHHHNNE
jgi:hypothetical protein